MFIQRRWSDGVTLIHCLQRPHQTDTSCQSRYINMSCPTEEERTMHQCL